MKVYELLSDASKWTQGTFARDKDGNDADWSSPSATCWCLKGEVNNCYRDSSEYAIHDKIRTDIGGSAWSISIPEWNDDPNRTYEDVVAVCKKLDI